MSTSNVSKFRENKPESDSEKPSHPTKKTSAAKITPFLLVKNLKNDVKKAKKKEEIESLMVRFTADVKENKLSVESIRQQLSTEINSSKLEEHGKPGISSHLEALKKFYDKPSLKP